MLIGRNIELELLEKCLHHAQNGEPRMLFLGAEAGGGKTELIKEFLKYHNDDAITLQVNCEPHKKSWGGYNEVVEILNILTAERPEVSPFIKKSLNATKKSASAIASLVPIVGTPLSSGITVFTNFREEFKANDPFGPQEGMHQLVKELNKMLQAASRNKAIILFFDDIHNASNSSLQLLSLLGKEIFDNSLRLLFIGTFRIQEVNDDPRHLLPLTIEALKKESGKAQSGKQTPKNQVVIAESRLQEIELKPFEVSDIHKVIERLFPDNTFPADFADKILQFTNGNPMFVCNLMECLKEEEVIIRNPDHLYELTDKELSQMPKSLNESIAKRVSFLNKEYKHILDYASVLGTRFELNLLEKLSSRDKIYLADHLRELEKQHNLINPAENITVENLILRYYAFSHILIRKYAYDSIDDKTRSIYHQQASEVIKYFFGDQFDKYPEFFEEYRNHLEAAQGLINGITLKLSDSATLHHTSEIHAQWMEVIEREFEKIESFLTQASSGDIHHSLNRIEVILKETGYKLEKCVKYQYQVHLYRTILFRLVSLDYFAYKESALLITSVDKLNDPTERIRSRFVCAKIQEINGFEEDSKYYIQEAETIYFSDFQDKYPETKALVRTLTNFFNKLKFFSYCAEINIWGLNAAIELKDISQELIFLNNTGVALANNKEFGNAVRYLKQAVELHAQLTDDQSNRVRMNNLAYCYEQNGDYEEALSVYYKMLEEALLEDDDLLIAEKFEQAGYIRFKLKQWEEGKNDLQMAIQHYEKIGNTVKVKGIESLLAQHSGVR